MPRIIETTLYKFEELSAEAQEKAIENNRYWNTEHVSWWDHTYSDFKRIASILGVEVVNIYHSHFYRQGQGAMFEGLFSYEKGMVAKIKEHAPKDTELHSIADSLQDLYRRSFYQVSGTVSHYGHCHHYNSTHWSIYGGSDEIVDGIEEEYKCLMRWLKNTLVAEHEYLTSDEAIKESLIANEVEFLESGARV